MSSWRYPELEDVDNIGFSLIRQHLYDMLYELHMTENQKLVESKGDVYWDNFCNMVEYLCDHIDEAIYHDSEGTPKSVASDKARSEIEKIRDKIYELNEKQRTDPESKKRKQEIVKQLSELTPEDLAKRITSKSDKRRT